jgi:hypothetical protein
MIPDRSGLRKSHSPQLMASGGCSHRPQQSGVNPPFAGRSEVQFTMSAPHLADESLTSPQPEIGS